MAELAGMSLTSFHRHFKAITTMSPLQYRTQFRLQEARRLMLVDEQNAGAVAFNVGYESPSQFSREYRRMFGLPPTTDVARPAPRRGNDALRGGLRPSINLSGNARGVSMAYSSRQPVSVR